MSIPAEIKASNQVRIVSYAVTAPPLVLWIGVLTRVLISKDRRKHTELIVISVLMILSLLADMGNWQLLYTHDDREYNGDINHPELWKQIQNAC